MIAVVDAAASTTLGQGLLFAADPTDGLFHYRVFDGIAWGPATTSLTLAVAQARAIALSARTAVVWADDGTSVTVHRHPPGFAVTAEPPPSWAAGCQLLLDRHG